MINYLKNQFFLTTNIICYKFIAINKYLLFMKLTIKIDKCNYKIMI